MYRIPRHIVGIFTVLLGLLILSSPLFVYADGSASVALATGSVLFVNNQPAPPQFQASFMSIREAHVTLSEQMYTFEMTVESSPNEWLTKAWNPTLTALPSGSSIAFVSYTWTLLDSSGNFLADLNVIWRQTEHGVSVSALAFVFVCPLDGFPGCEVSDVGPTVGSGVYLTPTSISFSIDQSMNSLSVTISRSDFANMFSSKVFNPDGLPIPTRWFARTFTTFAGTSIMDVAPGPNVSTSSVLGTQPSLSLPT